MTPKDVTEIVRRDIGHTTVNKFGWNFVDALLDSPEQRQYKNTDGSVDTYWTVLEEHQNDGYHIVYDAETKDFGIATSGTVVSFHSNFLSALNGL